MATPTFIGPPSFSPVTCVKHPMLDVQTLKPLIVIHRSGNFVYVHKIYRLLSYPFRPQVSLKRRNLRSCKISHGNADLHGSAIFFSSHVCQASYRCCDDVITTPKKKKNICIAINFGRDVGGRLGGVLRIIKMFN